MAVDQERQGGGVGVEGGGQHKGDFKPIQNR